LSARRLPLDYGQYVACWSFSAAHMSSLHTNETHSLAVLHAMPAPLRAPQVPP
jgi:hypothetical protein